MTAALTETTPGIGYDTIASQVECDAIARVHRPSFEDFQAEFVANNRPAIVTGVIDDWPALERWTPEYFAERFGDLDVHANVQRLSDELVLGNIGGFEPMKLGRLVETLREPNDGTHAHYLRAYPVHKLLDASPELGDDYRFLDFVDNWADVAAAPRFTERRANPFAALGLAFTKWFLNRGPSDGLSLRDRSDRVAAVMFMGGAGTITPFHSDGMMTGAYLAQVYGRKRCFFVSPEQDHTLYPRPFRKQFGMSQVDFRRPDLDRHPRFAEARILEGVLGPGEVLFTPGGWWHAIEALDVSISYSHQIVNAANALGWFTAIPERYVAQAYYALRGGLRNVTGAKDWDD